MKYIKLFENFNKLNIEDVISDIESIIYLLEDKEYRVSFYYKIPLVDGLIEWNNNTHRGQNADSATELVIVPIYEKPITKNPGDFINNNSPEWINAVNDFKNDMNIFINLLRDHLDYINPEKITLKEKPLVPPKYAFQINIDLK